MYNLEHKDICIRQMRFNSQNFSHDLFVSVNFKICLVNNGTAIWQIGDKCFSVKEGDIVILKSWQKRVIKEVSHIEGLDLFVLEFDAKSFFEQFQGLFMCGKIEKNCVMTEQPQMVKLFREIIQESEEKRFRYKAVMCTKLLEMFFLIERYYNITDTGEQNLGTEMYNILEYIDANYTSDISLQQISNAMLMSPSKFSRLFSKWMGMGMAQYVMHKRINKAIYLLRTSKRNVLDIAYDCGFNTRASFYKAFKKITNKSPNDYR